MFTQNRMKNLIGTLTLCLFLASCVEEIVMSPEEKRAVNVECVLENSETQTLHLNYTAYISENSHTPVEKADVKVIEYIKGNISYLKKNEGRCTVRAHRLFSEGNILARCEKREAGSLQSTHSASEKSND